ncbi:uncharacterized protein LOC128855022 [Anastrepha ludens]|uniref:uncharacterized protein LOC128855022 n=1 Tax=Anastrepha ludens TaxID=28586 RepID=UPI0023B0B6AF|nr:uncharacterized protein LOC128855022 [Anastrepha ludens]
MRPNGQSGCCTLENAANPATIRNLHTTYTFPPTVHLHSHLHSHPHQQAQQQQQQNHHHHNFHPQQQHHLQPQNFKPQAPTPWLPPQGLYNATPHPSTTSKNVVVGRHQALPFVAQSQTPLIKSKNHQQQHHQMLPAPPPPPHSHPQHQYQQYLNSLQHQSTHFPQKSQCVSQSTPTVAVAHHYNGYTPANTPRIALPPDQLSTAMPPVAPPSHPSNFAKLPSASVVNQQRVNECAGIPLISNATTHLASNQRQRVQRKLSRSPAPHQKLSTTGGIGTYKLQHPCAGLYIARNANAASCSHISQLAAHAQGAPLLVHKQQQQQNSVPKWPMPNSGSSAFQSTVSPQLSSNSSASLAAGGGKSHSEKPSRTTLRYQHSAPAALSTRDKENTTQATLETAVFAETSKDNAEGGETALPRIIKPRKRRKKDRKPTTNGVLLKLDALAGTGIAAEADRKPVQAHMPDMHQSQLLPRHHQQLRQQQQHLTHLYPHENSNENLYKFINFYIGTHQPTENVVSTRAFNSNEPLLDYKPRSLLQSPCLKSFGCLGGIKHKQGDMSQDEHGICFCQDCDPLRSIWDYPLRRSLSDSSAASIRTHSSSSSSSSSSHGSSSETTSSSGSSAPLTDDALSPSTALSRADRVGVIGSNRNGQDCNRDATKRTDTGCEVLGGRHPTNGCLSDSNDSGYGDILSGINIADDFFSQSAYNMSTALRPLFEANDLVLDVGQSSIDQSMKYAQSYSSVPETLLPLLPATADALLTESINEISRKLIETCGSELPNELTGTTTRSISAYSRCSSDFSADSGIDSAAIVNCDELVFKFDNLNFMIDNVAKQTTSESNHNNNNFIGANNNNSATAVDDIAATTTTLNAFSELLKLPGTATGTTTTNVTNEGNFFIDKPNMNLLFDLNNNNKGSIFEIENENEDKCELEREQLRQPLAEKNQHDQQFINNCFDLVWPTTFDHCIGVEKQLGALTHREIA